MFLIAARMSMEVDCGISLKSTQTSIILAIVCLVYRSRSIYIPVMSLPLEDMF
jgi:hypothetical protein